MQMQVTGQESQVVSPNGILRRQTEGPKGSIKPGTAAVRKAFCVQCQLAAGAVHFYQVFKVRQELGGDLV